MFIPVCASKSKTLRFAAVPVKPSNLLSSSVEAVIPSSVFNSAVFAVIPSSVFNSAVFALRPSRTVSSDAATVVSVPSVAIKCNEFSLRYKSFQGFVTEPKSNCAERVGIKSSLIYSKLHMYSSYISTNAFNWGFKIWSVTNYCFELTQLHIYCSSIA